MQQFVLCGIQVRQMKLFKLDSKKYKIDYPYLKRNGKILCLFKQLYELKEIELIIEQAEWALKTVAERTERFEPPMWEDRTIDHKGYTFTFVLRNEVYVFRVNQFKDEIRISKIEYDGLLFNDRETTLYLADTFTKENYEKACEIVRDFFKGEK